MDTRTKSKPVTPAHDMQSRSPFALSRIQAEGWNAARKYLAGGDPDDAGKIAALNPYRTPVERARWNTASTTPGTSSDQRLVLLTRTAG